MFVIDHDALSGVVNKRAVANRHIKPHFGLFLGCGCQYFSKGEWIDSTPRTPISSGQAPDKLCITHMKDFYNGTEIKFP